MLLIRRHAALGNSKNMPCSVQTAKKNTVSNPSFFAPVPEYRPVPENDGNLPPLCLWLFKYPAALSPSNHFLSFCPILFAKHICHRALLCALLMQNRQDGSSCKC